MELDILMVIAEIAVALAGFAAVVANFSENWTKAKSEQLANLLTQSGIALFASMVPLIMSQIRVDEEAGNDTVWMVSSACYVFFATSYLVVSLLLSRGRGTGACVTCARPRACARASAGVPVCCLAGAPRGHRSR